VTGIVSVKINDGIVMASDRASTFDIGQAYLPADKIVTLVKGLPISMMVTGAGHIGAESIAKLLKDLGRHIDQHRSPSMGACPLYVRNGGSWTERLRRERRRPPCRHSVRG